MVRCGGLVSPSACLTPGLFLSLSFSFSLFCSGSDPGVHLLVPVCVIYLRTYQGTCNAILELQSVCQYQVNAGVNYIDNRHALSRFHLSPFPMTTNRCMYVHGLLILFDQRSRLGIYT